MSPIQTADLTDEILASHERWNLFGPLDKASLKVELNRSSTDGPLAGRKVGLKANIAVEGAPWTAGLAHRSELKASADAGVTRLLRSAGASILPGLNMDPAALGGSTDNPDFGRTDNPRASGHSAGGSSGGSAAAVACGLANLALGTDTMGSIRIPASYCGVYGLKPTFGLVGRSGIVPLAPSLDVVGPITSNAADLWLVLKLIATPDPEDADSCLTPGDWREQAPSTDLTGTTIGIPEQIAEVDCELKVLEEFERAVGNLAELGAEVRTIEMAGWVPAKLRKAAFLVTECEGARCHAKALAEPGTLPDMIEGLLAYGRDISSDRLIAALSEMRTAKAQFYRTLNEVDLIALPTTPQRAFPATNNPPANQADFTVPANVSGLPAVAVPISCEGPPCSIQLIGSAFSESSLVGAAMALELHQSV